MERIRFQIRDNAVEQESAPEGYIATMTQGDRGTQVRITKRAWERMTPESVGMMVDRMLFMFRTEE
jgi:hypothetical protein